MDRKLLVNVGETVLWIFFYNNFSKKMILKIDA
jgi:hypothetical protein